MAYGDFKDLNSRTAANKLFRVRAFNVAKNPKYDGLQRGLASMVYKFFNKKVSDGAIRNEIMSNKELDKELHKPIIRKLEKRKVHPPFIENIWGNDLENMCLIIKFIKEFRFLLCVIDIYSKYTWLFLKGIILLLK